jgi:hypothetical protein
MLSHHHPKYSLKMALKSRNVLLQAVNTQNTLLKGCVRLYVLYYLTEKHTTGKPCLKIVNSCFGLYLCFPTASCPSSPLLSWKMIGGSVFMAALVVWCWISWLKCQNKNSFNQKLNMYSCEGLTLSLPNQPFNAERLIKTSRGEPFKN